TDACDRYGVLFGLFDRTARFLAERAIRFAVVLAPTREEVAAGASPVHARIMDFCRIRSLRCVSLLDRLHRETALGDALYFAGDLHWTREGHRVVADELGHLTASLAVAHAR